MRLTAKLAYSQLRINRSRTVWTLVGIALSTALITAVCCFAASGNALLADLFGEGYAEYSGLITGLLLVPVGILSMIIASMAVIVISNAFRVSAGERVTQFGILKSVGATKRQITESVMYESVLLSAAGIPAGIAVGLITAFVGVQVANYFLGELNSLVNLMMTEFTVLVDFVIAWQAIIAAALISFLTVLFSAWLPASKAAKSSAIDSIRGEGEVKINAKSIYTSRLPERFFGFEGTLAAKNMKRSRRNFRSSVMSLTIGIVLFVNLGSLSRQIGLIEGMIYPDINETVMVDYSSLRGFSVNESTGKEETIIISPIDSEAAEDITEKLRQYEDTAVLGIGVDMDTYAAVLPREMISERMLEVYFLGEVPVYEASAEIITLDRDNYAALCERAGVPVGSNILLNHYSYNDNGNEVAIAPFICEGRTFQLIKADDSILEIPVHGELTYEDIPNVFFNPNVKIVRLIVPQGIMRDYSWYADPVDIDGFMDYANAVMGEVFPQGQVASYTEAGFNTRVYLIEDYVRVMNIAIVLISVFIYSFVAMLVLIGLTGVISTMSANVRMRAKEFAVLQSVGMTREGLKRMLNLESVMCTARALIIGLPIAVVLTYLINMPIRSRFPVPYQLPWLAMLWCLAGVFAITWVTTRYSARKLFEGNIVETIRSGRGM